ncbi:MAG: DUF6314 family protein [Dinoroseobacter sp.]|nr:DUF6314 family protein [Dinoroseobacter sp.]
MGLPQGLADFEGRWYVTRRIEDRRGPEGRFEGAADFTRTADGLTYSETGQLSAGGQSFAATRRYLWREASDQIEVLFEDGRPFHVFALNAQPSAAHDCAPDRYDVAYDFRKWPTWRAVWDVHGPRKDYRMVTEYRRG